MSRAFVQKWQASLLPPPLSLRWFSVWVLGNIVFYKNVG
jgi:hypothetical protein